jgi:uncharacterized RDD family membrane protein YckC
MRCPKCHYVSFDGQNRCRNCGYDLSLAQPSEPLDVSTRPGNPTAAPLADLALNAPPPAEAPSAAAGPAGSGPGAGRARAFDRGYEPPRHRAPEVDPLELPLFEARPATGAAREAAAREVADRPLISPNTPPRPPLAVRRPTGELPRARARVTPGAMPPRMEEPRLELDLPDRGGPDRAGSDRAGDFGDMPDPVLLDDPGITSRDARDARDARDPRDARDSRGYARDLLRDPSVDASRDVSDTGAGARASAATGEADDAAADSASADAAVDPTIAPLGGRIIAALVDLAFLAAIDGTVLHFTLRLTGLTLAESGRLPLAPLFGFLALLNGGYLTMFIAASGQTMGKMMTGVKVVAMDGGAVPFGHAVLRAILWLLTIVPLGIGALPALLTDDRRALHDRLANTRVIKAE